MILLHLDALRLARVNEAIFQLLLGTPRGVNAFSCHGRKLYFNFKECERLSKKSLALEKKSQGNSDQPNNDLTIDIAKGQGTDEAIILVIIHDIVSVIDISKN